MTTDNDLAPVAAVVVLAAGGGTRMKSSTSKLLHEVAGRPMLSYAVSAAAALDPEHLVVVVGHHRQQVLEHLDRLSETVTTAVQEEQRGTGHAVSCAIADLPDLDGDVVVTYADVPMLTGETLRHLVAVHRAKNNAVTVMSARVDDPTGYGRIVRDGDRVVGIVEHRDATPQQRDIDEINSGIYVFAAATLRAGLATLNTDNAQGEQYLTDVVAFASDRGDRVGAHLIDDVWQTEGVNDRVQLARMNQEMNRRIRDAWMLRGVTMLDPNSTWIDVDVDLAQDVTLRQGVILQGATTVGEGAVIGPDTTLMDVEVGPGAEVVRSHGSFAVIGRGAQVGPFACLRPGTVLGADGKIGTFVETKNADLGDAVTISHLAYVGDAIVGEGGHIAAGAIVANFDGESKSSTHIGSQAFVGSNCVLVAPVDVGDGALVAAGSAITSDVPAGALGIGRARQHNVEGWLAKARPSSPQAAAAAASEGAVHPAVVESREKQG